MVGREHLGMIIFKSAQDAVFPHWRVLVKTKSLVTSSDCFCSHRNTQRPTAGDAGRVRVSEATFAIVYPVILDLPIVRASLIPDRKWLPFECYYHTISRRAASNVTWGSKSATMLVEIGYTAWTTQCTSYCGYQSPTICVAGKYVWPTPALLKDTLSGEVNNLN